MRYYTERQVRWSFHRSLQGMQNSLTKKTSMGLAALIENMRRSKLGKKGTENRSTARTTEV